MIIGWHDDAHARAHADAHGHGHGLGRHHDDQGSHDGAAVSRTLVMAGA